MFESQDLREHFPDFLKLLVTLLVCLMVTEDMIDRLEKEVEMLSRHLDVFSRVVQDEPIGIVNLSNETGHPHHKVRYSLRILEEEELIEPTSTGAVCTDEAESFLSNHGDSIDHLIERLEEVSNSG